jgi:hypothetical protein
LPFFRGFNKILPNENSQKTEPSSSLLMKTKSTSQTVQKPFWKHAILLSMAALGLCASPAGALAAECLTEATWIGTTGSWFVAMNWLNQQPPTVAIGAQINNGGTAQVNSSGAVACDLTVGFSATQSGTVSVNSGSLAVGQEAEIGGTGQGKLMVTNGGSVTVGFLTIAALSGGSSAGTVSIDASSLSCTSPQGIWVGGDPGGPGGIGLLSVTNGGTVSAGIGNSGVIYVFSSGTLTGNGTVRTTPSGITIDGTLKPSGGTLSITGNGSVTLNAGATMLSNVVPSSADNVHVSGSGGVFLNGRLAVTMTGTFTPGTTYTLLTADGGRHDTRFSSVSITFPPGQGWSPVIIYDTNNVKLNLASTTGP